MVEQGLILKLSKLNITEKKCLILPQVKTC